MKTSNRYRFFHFRTGLYNLVPRSPKLPVPYCTLILSFLLFALPQPLSCQTSSPTELVENGGYIVTGVRPKISHRATELFIPASTIKILTSLAAIDFLGITYRFETQFHLDEKKNLLIKGYGDPLLTSEVLINIAAELKGAGISKVSSLILDDSSFSLGGTKASNSNSHNPYDAPNGALAVNFNALPVMVDREGALSSGEPQTPLLPLMTEFGKVASPGFNRFNIDTIPRASALSNQLRYVGELAVAQFEANGLSVANGFSAGKVQAGSPPLMVYRSDKTLLEVVRRCLKYSNNYIANQILLVCGMKRYGLPATWAKGRRFLSDFIADKLRLNGRQIQISEGSGISRDNRITPTAMIQILDTFKPYATLLSGRESVLLKSGTLNDVYCYAGYFRSGSRLDPFVIFLNQPDNTRETLLNRLQKQYLLQTD